MGDRCRGGGKLEQAEHCIILPGSCTDRMLMKEEPACSGLNVVKTNDKYLLSKLMFANIIYHYLKILTLNVFTFLLIHSVLTYYRQFILIYESFRVNVSKLYGMIKFPEILNDKKVFEMFYICGNL